MKAKCQKCSASSETWAVGKAGLIYCRDCFVPRGAVHKGTVTAKGLKRAKHGKPTEDAGLFASISAK